jgi:hypothetical protein
MLLWGVFLSQRRTFLQPCHADVSMQYRGCELADGVYTAVARDAEIEILGLVIRLARNPVLQEVSGVQNYPP